MAARDRTGPVPQTILGIPLSRPRIHPWFKIGALFGLLLASMWPAAMSLVSTEKSRYFNIDAAAIAKALTDPLQRRQYPRTLEIPGSGLDGPLKVEFTLDPDLQQEAERLLAKHNPDYAVLVALDPDTGRILAMADSTRGSLPESSLILRNTYPAASVSKIVTAVAAMDQGEISEQTVIPFNGKTTTLYKKNVFRHKKNKWTREPTFRESFAKSNNTVFGRVGAVTLGGDKLLEYFQRLGFNARFASDFVFHNGAIELDPADQWQVAESASGYTRRNTLSPLHAAALAATAVNGGRLVAPVVVERVLGPNGIPVYQYDDPAVSPAMSSATAEQLKQLMIATVNVGSARKSFRRFHRGDFENVVVGGKTGSLTGSDPQGRYDWFAGFGELGDRRIAFAALCINKEKWYVKSARLSRELLQHYFQPRET